MKHLNLMLQHLPFYALTAVGVIYSIVLHEVAHGLAAYWGGDDTAKRAGRLTLNPLSHVDWVGTVILPVMLVLLGMPVFGWAKPVPVSFAKLRTRFDRFRVAVAGVTVNFILAILFFMIFGQYRSQILLQLGMVNIVLMVFNLIPLPPLDGYRIWESLLPAKYMQFVYRHESTIQVIFILLLVSGLLRYIYVPISLGLARFFVALFAGG